MGLYRGDKKVESWEQDSWNFYRLYMSFDACKMVFYQDVG